MKIKLKYLEEEKSKSEIENRNQIALYILGIKVKKIKLNRKIHGKKNSNKYVDTIYMIAKQILRATKNEELLKVGNKIIKTIKIEKLDLNLGLNFQDPILNAYSVAIVNSVLPTILAKQQIALNNLQYNTFIANKIIYIDAYVTIQFPIFRNIYNIIQIIIIILKENKNKNKNSKKITSTY